MASVEWQWHRDQFFDPDPAQRRLVHEPYNSVADLPLICPHGHVNPLLFADENVTFDTPTEMLIPRIIMYSVCCIRKGSLWNPLSTPRLDGSPVERDPRSIWQIFGER